jgi:hypothetical protein
MSKKKSNGKATGAVNGDVIGREMRIVRRNLDDEAIEELRGKMRRTYAAQRQEQSSFTGFRKWAEPRARAALDPDYENDSIEGERLLDEVEARALHDEVEHRRKLKSSRVNAVKAERRLLMDAIANGYEHRIVECECRANVDALSVQIVDPATGDVVDERPMTGPERQMSMPGDELPSNGAQAPDAVM